MALNQSLIESQLNYLEKQDLLRNLSPLPGTGGKFVMEGEEILNFSSNDYLNLANHPDIKDAAIDSIEKWGCGAGASRLMSGHLDLHLSLEAALASACNTESALVFGSGFLANYGLLTCLLNKGDLILADRLNHASLIDGMVNSGAPWIRYPHKDFNQLKTLLKNNKPKGKTVIVTDSLFSMDGDLAPLREISEIAQDHQAWLIVDEAHAMGLLGKNGGGYYSELGLCPGEKTIILGTLSKALSSYGGFAACSQEVRTFLVNKARSFIYSTALPPASAAAALSCLCRIKREPSLGRVLLNKAEYLSQALKKAGFSIQYQESQIIPIMIGENKRALEFARKARDKGIILTAIRPPTVPKGTARIRLSVTLAHSKKDLDKTIETLMKIGRELGLI